ncbi:MAG: putative efflux pump membrane fusion protein [Chloroflexi bacterium ADurb.Bin360]|nr:MAG: putative efflux pump membrane fusion protein [Chloroflexi bacterium ADurb.Bin360]
MKPKKLIFIILGVVIVAALVCALSGQLGKLVQASNPEQTPAAAETPVEVAVRARGQVIPGTWGELSFGGSGQLVEWLVAEGEEVAAGQVLGRLNTAPAELALRQAQLDLEIARDRLEKADLDQHDRIQEAELALSQAEGRLAQSGARYPSIAQAQVNLERAQKALIDAEEAYRQTSEYPGMFETPGVREHYQENIDRAKQDLTVAQAAYNSSRGEQAATTQERQILETEVTRARMNLEIVQRGADPSLAQDIRRAELQVERAQADLEAMTLRAPFAGTVVRLRIKPEDWAQPGMAVLTLADLNTLRVETSDLDEWGVTRIAIGDMARITFTAFDEKTVTGRVSEIALRGEALTGGDVAYRVLITLDEPDPDLRWGMTVRVSIPVEE